MFANKGVTVIFCAITFTLSSSLAFAAQNSNASFAGWPLLVLFAAIFIFRKKIFADTSGQESETEQPTYSSDVKEDPAAVVAIQEESKPKKAATKAKTKAKNSPNIIDLTEDGKQCQASTTKGSRCKRTNTLVNTKLEIDGTTYQITVCSQHNNDSLKAYSKLIKK